MLKNKYISTINYIRRHILFIVIGLVVVGTVAFAATRNYQVQQDNSEIQQEFVPEFENEQTIKPVEEGVSAGIKIPGYSSIIINANIKDVAVDLVNPEENKVYFKISFMLTDSKETIYQSKLIKPGQHLYNITLDKKLEVGEYNLTIIYETFSMDGNYTNKNGASVNCILKAV